MNKRPRIGRYWRRRRNEALHTVESLDEHGVSLKMVVEQGYCRLPLEKFLERFRVIRGVRHDR